MKAPGPIAEGFNNSCTHLPGLRSHHDGKGFYIIATTPSRQCLQESKMRKRSNNL